VLAAALQACKGEGAAIFHACWGLAMKPLYEKVTQATK
jgi:hypothetical protein